MTDDEISQATLHMLNNEADTYRDLHVMWRDIAKTERRAERIASVSMVAMMLFIVASRWFIQLDHTDQFLMWAFVAVLWQSANTQRLEARISDLHARNAEARFLAADKQRQAWCAGRVASGH